MPEEGQLRSQQLDSDPFTLHRSPPDATAHTRPRPVRLKDLDPGVWSHWGEGPCPHPPPGD